MQPLKRIPKVIQRTAHIFPSILKYLHSLNYIDFNSTLEPRGVTIWGQKTLTLMGHHAPRITVGIMD